MKCNVAAVAAAVAPFIARRVTFIAFISLSHLIIVRDNVVAVENVTSTTTTLLPAASAQADEARTQSVTAAELSISELNATISEQLHGTHSSTTPPAHASSRRKSSKSQQHRHHTTQTQTQTHVQTQTQTQAKRKWFSQIFEQAKLSFDISTDASDRCRHDYNVYRTHLNNQTVWAIRMLESSEWPSVGLFSGKLFHTGDWDECLKARGPANIKGKYCLVQASINISSTLKSERPYKYFDDTGWPDEDASAWDIIDAFDRNPKRRDRNKYTWALCLPSSCSLTDVQTSLNGTLKPIFQTYNLDIDVRVHPKLCKMQQEHYYPLGYYVAWMVFSLIISLVITSSVYDFREISIKGESDCWFALKLFKCFSIRHSFVNLTNATSPASMTPGIYLVKIIYFMLIVNGHRDFSEALAFSTSQSEVLEMSYTSDFVYLLNMDVIDVFFMIAGFLTLHLGYGLMSKIGAEYILLSILIRWFKLMPVYGLLLLFITQILPYSGEGPWWDYRFLAEVENCKATWWTQLLAVSNVFKSQQQCFMATWYISVEIQLSVVGAILLYITTRNSKMGFLAISMTFLIFTEISGIIVFKRRYHGTLIMLQKTLEHLKTNEEFYRYYIIGATRVGPYLVGFTAAFLVKELKDRNFKFTSKQKWSLIVGSWILGRAVLYYGFIFYKHTSRFIPVENAIYAAIHRPLYVLPIATLLLIYFNSGLGKLNGLFEIKVFVPLGRLVYSAFLTHSVIQLYHVSSQRGLLFLPRTLNLHYTVSADVILSFFAGFILFMVAEGPFHSITLLLHPAIVGDLNKTDKPFRRESRSRSRQFVPHFPPDGTFNKAFDMTEEGEEPPV